MDNRGWEVDHVAEHGLRVDGPDRAGTRAIPRDPRRRPCGQCPGTAAGALGEGRIDGLWGILGMLCGGALYAVIYPFMKAHIIGIGNYGPIVIPQIIGINHWVVVALLAGLTIVLFRWFERKGL